MQKGKMLCFYSLLLLLVVSVSAKKILLLPFPFMSHVSEASHIADGLLQNGHQLTMIMSPSYPDNKKIAERGFDVWEYHLLERDFFGMDEGDVGDMFESLITTTPIQDFRTNIDGFIQMCSNPLSDQTLLRKIENEKFDLAIVDGFPCSRCLLAIPYMFGIPYVTFTSIYEPWLFRTPALPSFVPFQLAQYYTERMTLWEKFISFGTLVDWSMNLQMEYISDTFMRKYLPDTPDRPYKSTDELARLSMLWLFGSDFIIDYSRPMMPNEINIGGMSTKPAKPLNTQFQEIIQNSQNGIVLVSFGSTFFLPMSYIHKMLSAFSQFPEYKFIWSFAGQDVSPEIEIPPNVNIMSWLPQNDLLGHPKIKLFITHCGANGQFEAVYHAVPMLGLPIFGDQPYNARRAEYHGYGLHLDITTFTVDEMADTIRELLHNSSYKANILHASRVFKSRPQNPRERAVSLVEHVMEFGGKHMHSHALDMPWYEFLMLDMLAVCVVAYTIVVVMVLWLCYKICGKSRVDKPKND